MPKIPKNQWILTARATVCLHFLCECSVKKKTTHTTVFCGPFKNLTRKSLRVTRMCSTYQILNINARSSPSEDRKSFPYMKHPIRVGEYSTSPQGIFENSPSRLCILTSVATNKFPFSLNPTRGDRTAQQFSHMEWYLDNMFRFLRCSMEKFIKRNTAGVLQVDADIVCTREVLQLIMCAPYEEKKNWKLALSKYRNTIYICPVKSRELPILTFEAIQANNLSMWMRKLRQICLVPNNDVTVQPTRPQLGGQYYCVFRTEVCGLNVLFDAPVIADQCPNPLGGLPKPFVDIHLRLDPMNPAEWAAHKRNEMLKWWVDSFLVGIDKVSVAYHDRNAFVHKVKQIKVRKLWRECEHEWSPNISGNFLKRFFSIIHNLFSHVDNASTAYILEFDATNGNITSKLRGERNEHTFIPDWFRVMMEEKMDYLNSDIRFQT